VTVSVSTFERRAALVPWGVTASWALPALALSLLTANPELTFWSVASLAVLVLLLWRLGEAPILLFVCWFQWLQACLKVFHADVLGVELRTLMPTRSGEEAVIYSLGWAVAIGFGMRAALAASPRGARTVASIEPIDFRRLVTVYLVWTVLQPILDLTLSGGARQIVVALSNLRWGLFFALLLEALRNRKHLGTAAAAFTFELATSFLSFFSEFKTPIYVLALVLPTANVRLAARHVLGGLAVAALALYLAVVWSAIKGDYRDRISEYKGEQSVSVSTEQQIGELVSSVGTVDEAGLLKGWQRLLDRVAYVDYFSYTLEFVPALRRHEEGALWGAAFQHVLMPRLLFPDKPGLESDTMVTERYTGLVLRNTTSRASSISIGTPGETYIDFAWPGMLGLAFAIGVLYALLWRLSRRGGHRLVDVGMSVALLLPFHSLEQSATKLLGGVLTNTIILVLIRPVLDAVLNSGTARQALMRPMAAVQRLPKPR
jgi:hypothetical protein